MNNVIRWTILAILIFAAISCYSYGNSTGAVSFFIIGAMFELAFWFGVFSKNK